MATSPSSWFIWEEPVKMIRSVIRSIFKEMGYDLYRKDHFDIRWPHDLIGFDGEDEARANIRKVRDYTMVAYASLATLWQQIRFCEEQGVTGDYVECGVWKGGSIGLIALANLTYGSSRRPIHLFDVFDDICEPDPAVDGARAIAEVQNFAGRDRASAPSLTFATDFP